MLLGSILLASLLCFKKLKTCYTSWPEWLALSGESQTLPGRECARGHLTDSSNQNISSESWRYNAESMLKLFIPCSFPLLLFCFCHDVMMDIIEQSYLQFLQRVKLVCYFSAFFFCLFKLFNVKWQPNVEIGNILCFNRKCVPSLYTSVLLKEGTYTVNILLYIAEFPLVTWTGHC